MNEVNSVLQSGFTVGTFPLYPEQVRKLIESHKEMEDHKLLLAIWYDKDEQRDIKILEVLEGFPSSDDETELFTTYFTSSSKFLIAAEGKLILSLTNPEEMKNAIKQKIPIIKEIMAALARGQAKVLYKDAEMEDIVNALHS